MEGAVAGLPVAFGHMTGRTEKSLGARRWGSEDAGSLGKQAAAGP
jgi:hypothetical protein